jgi:resolvase-like protein
MSRLDRLGRSLGDLTHLTNELKSRNVEFGSLTEKVETGSPTQKQLFDKMWQLPDIEKINLSEGRAAKELAPVTPAPAQEHHAAGGLWDCQGFVCLGCTELKLTLIDQVNRLSKVVGYGKRGRPCATSREQLGEEED